LIFIGPPQHIPLHLF